MNSKHYILNVILNIIAIFLIFASWICVSVMSTFANSSAYTKIVKDENICTYASESIKKSFEEYAHTSGIDAETFSAYYDESFIKANINENITSYLDFLFGKSGGYDYSSSIDFSAADAEIDNFFDDYAQKTNYEKDEVYEEKLAEVKEKAHDIFIEKTDVFRFSMMNDEGILEKVSSKISLVKIMVAACFAAAVVIVLLMIIINRKENVLYWLGCPFLVSGILLLIPTIYIKASGFINGFTVKEKTVFYSVTGLLNKTLDHALAFAAVSAIFGAVFLFLGIILKKREKE